MEDINPHSPPSLSEQQFDVLIESIKDYQITHGSLLKHVHQAQASLALTRAVPVSLFPTTFPKGCFDSAVRIQETYNDLYARISQDEGFLFRVLQPLIQDDPFTKILWNIHVAAKQEGLVQPLTLGIFRSDYMIHVSAEDTILFDTGQNHELKQVEFNTFSVAGAAHSDIVAGMYLHMHKTGAYSSHFGDPAEIPSSIPPNRPIAGLVEGLASAHSAYGAPKGNSSKRTGILFIVQHDNFNIGDERPLEYGLWDRPSPIPAYRLEFRSILKHVSLGPSKELLFSSQSCPLSPLEISVVYFRAGYEPEEYDADGRAARLLLEQSLAIKCPSILSHLTTFKKVQQALAMPGVLEQYLSPPQCSDIRATFAPMYPLDTSDLGLRARALATNTETAANYILKPSLEGGGNNIYGEDIPLFLSTVPRGKWPTYILMEYINSPAQHGNLMSSEGSYEGPTISELGIFGVCLWREGRDGRTVEVIDNREVGWSFKTKPEEMEEMSVVKGYGFFNSPSLVDY
jgi:glutathione synthase